MPTLRAPQALEHARARLRKAPTTSRFVSGPATPIASRFGVWLNRSRRILLTLAGVWIISVFDLFFTLNEAMSANFVELNPVAATLLHGPPNIVAAFKFGLLGGATVILLALRRHFIAELACWFLLATKVYVAVRWFSYYDCLMNDYVDPLIVAPW